MFRFLILAQVVCMLYVLRQWFFTMLKFFFSLFFRSEELKSFFFSRAEHFFFFFYFFFSFRSWAYWRCPLHYYYHLVVFVFLLPSSSFSFPLYTVFSHTGTRIHRHIMRSRVREYSYAKHSYCTYWICVHIYVRVRACVCVCATCLRGTSVQCSIRNHMFFFLVFIGAPMHKYPPDGVLNVKCTVGNMCSIYAWSIWWHFLNRWFSFSLIQKLSCYVSNIFRSRNDEICNSFMFFWYGDQGSCEFLIKYWHLDFSRPLNFIAYVAFELTHQLDISLTVPRVSHTAFIVNQCACHSCSYSVAARRGLFLISIILCQYILNATANM